jgi:hypothetical protein
MNEPGGIERLPDPPDPRGSGSETSSRQRQTQTAEQIASETGVDRDGIGSVNRMSGFDFFLRSSGEQQFSQNVQEEFAEPADFVKPQNVEPNIDGQEITADPQVAPGARETIEQRAEAGAAADKQFARPGDFDAEVSNQGVTDLGFTETGRRNRAARELESQTPLQAVDPASDITRDGDAFELDASAARRSSARGFEDRLDPIDQGELDPSTDVRNIDGGGFGLSEPVARETAAEQIDEQIERLSIGPDDITLEQRESGEFVGRFSGEVSR